MRGEKRGERSVESPRREISEIFPMANFKRTTTHSNGRRANGTGLNSAERRDAYSPASLGFIDRDRALYRVRQCELCVVASTEHGSRRE